MKRTLQEFADLFGVYTAQMSHGRRVAYENKPKIDRHIDICNEMLLETWLYTGESTCIDMFTEPFEGDWRDSLHSPRVVCPDCNGTSISTEYYLDDPQARFLCETCDGTGWVERYDAFEKENIQLREALQALYDAQNGVPLERDRQEWEEAMRMAEEVLMEVK